MSLLLDALRRAAASKQGPDADQYVAPQRDDVILEPDTHTGIDTDTDADVVDEAKQAVADGGSGTARPVEEQAELPGEELSLEPEPEPEREAGTKTATGDTGTAAPEFPPSRDGGPAAPAARTAPRTAATTLLNARRGGRRPVRGILIASLAVIATALLLAAGGWWYYQYSRQAAEQGLAAYQPTAEPLVELPAAGEGDGGADTGGAGMATDEVVGDAVPDPATDAETTAATPEAIETASAAEPETAEPEAVTEAAATNGSGEDAAAASTNAEPEPPATEPETTTSTAAAEPEPREGGESAGGRESQSSQATASERPAKRQAQPLVTTSGTSVMSTALNTGYDALRAGDLATADREYSRALARDPDNRDALLGLASVAQRRGEPERAARYYQRILEDNPRDPHARAGLASLFGRIEPRRSETVLKRLLGDQPDSPSLHFALGNVYAGESRWSEAQQAFFKAYRGEPDNAEYAYNLAVALDHLQQRDAAMDHYRAALEVLGGESTAAFSAEAVRRRIAQLEQE